MSLKARLEAEIAVTGPISVAEYMMRCLHDPKDGYYATRPALGEAGDFITAPAVSQMFGELIGVWLIETWRRMGAPTPFILAEAGPGDGTLMGDVLKVGQAAPDFRAGAEVWLLEASAPLRALQAQKLAGRDAHWAASLADLPAPAPLLLIANEFLDCLPARQYRRTAQGWAEQMVGLDDDGRLAFGLRPAPLLDLDAPANAIVERSPAQEAFAAALAERLVAHGGAALLIDYGRAAPDFGDTLQAVARHRKVDPLAAPGEADLTVHVDFPAVLAAARAAGAETGLLTQGEFLRRMGVEARAAALAKARPDRADQIRRQLERLASPDQMGETFKATAIWKGPAPPAFEVQP
jgi:SAM-dependent MidA family methyltransferase